ncbi:hypothetical protein [Actinomycetospora flava]|uniref:mRNA-degrading endonuclease RelE of RelBE toxin-antitoxin system n=1 Tax=Actinomycetospora flava TaxID=3129232 RepID=A0ABU8MB82_9PSEU
MSYELEPEALDEFRAKVAELPDAVRSAIEDVIAELGARPWHSLPMNEANPNGQYRFVAVDVATGYGFVTFVVLEAEHRVSMVDLVWFAYD